MLGANVAPWPVYDEEEREAVAEVLRSGRVNYWTGEETRAFEREFAAFADSAKAVAVANGTLALDLVLAGLGIGPGDEVVTSTYSFFATAGCVSRVGATPVLVDIDPVTYNLDPDAVRAAITPRTRAIIPVHLYGLCADMDPILKIAADFGLEVIEDACQAIGARYRGRPAGSMGAAGCFSFFPSKNLGAFGDAGLVTTNDSTLAHELRLLRNHGAEPKYFHKRIGANFRLDAIQAAVLRVKLPHLPRWTDMRRANAGRYDALFQDAGLTSRITLPVEPAGYRHIFNQYVVRVPDRDRVRAYLGERGIGTEIYYPVPFHLQECFASLGHVEGDFPQAEAAAASTLALPIYGELTADQQAAVVTALAAALDS